MREGETPLENGPASLEETLERVGPLLVLPQRSFGIEVGTERGIHARLIMEVVHPEHLTVCDIWPDPGIAEMAFDRLRPYPNVKIRRKRSTDLAQEFPVDYFDWVYIDANHSHDAVKADIAAWFPKIKLDGWLLCHDMWIPDVERAVTESLAEIQDLHLVAIGEDRLKTAIMRKCICEPEVK